ncbi:CYFA0S01e19405g1_1 [Cyberlindnera fabianii]|uniref:CYFA0S01e19405g1_1 n=1 Tax=Cyberlindnera fabianii TaxID=36022 RepID=A0A061AK66_CYBFA|nr:CYFA0S01e19405g1_1 [Cyberlindnera fabianii]
MSNSSPSYIERLRTLWLQEGIVTPVTTSIPRDCLQAERSLLLYCKLSSILAMISLSMFVDFNLLGTTIEGHAPHFSSEGFSKAVGAIFFVLSIGSLTLGALNYFENIHHFIGQRRLSGPRLPTEFFVGITVVTLLAVNIALLVDSKYWQ